MPHTPTLTTETKLTNAMRDALLSLASADGINASGRDEVYGCTFGRDTAITVLEILHAQKAKPDAELLALSRRALLTLASLAGTEKNIETGEEPGKFIHEFRRERFEHLTQGENWMLHPDGTMRNYDSIDSTPLSLIAIYRYYELTGDEDFLNEALPAVEAGLGWLAHHADRDQDGFIDYEFHPERTRGGLRVQSWTDSIESMRRPDGTFPKYPIAPVEAQAYAWLAWKLWADYFEPRDLPRATDYRMRAVLLKQNFNQWFIYEEESLTFAAQAIDGEGNLIKTVTANPALALWAAYQGPEEESVESIFDAEVVPDIVARIFKDDMFESFAGIRTMSTLSPTYNAQYDSYHNGSFWPMVNGLIFEALLAFGYGVEAAKLRNASLAALVHYGTPVELYLRLKDAREYTNYRHACQVQAWSAGAFYDMLVSGDRLPQESPLAPLESEAV